MSLRQRFRTGERIPYSGIYRVFHASHRLPHEVTLLDGETFPRCLKCDQAVEFQLIQQAPDLRNDSGFRVVLFGLPDTEESSDESVTPGIVEPTTDTAISPTSNLASITDRQTENQKTEGRQTEDGHIEDRHIEDRQAEGFSQAARNQSDTLPSDGLKRSSTKHKPRHLQRFKPGDLVPEHGIYSVEHDLHGLFHQATLGKDSVFPRCRTCGSEVRFRLLRPTKPGAVSPLSSSILEDLDAPKPPSTKVG